MVNVLQDASDDEMCDEYDEEVLAVLVKKMNEVLFEREKVLSTLKTKVLNLLQLTASATKACGTGDMRRQSFFTYISRQSR